MSLGRGNGNRAFVDLGSQLSGGHSVNGASHGAAGSEYLLDRSGKLAGQRTGTHLAGNVNDGVERQVSVVLDVLFLLAVSWRLLERLDDEAGGGRHGLNTGNAVLHDDLATQTQTLEGGRLLLDVFVHLFGGDTEGTDLLGERRTSTFSTDNTDENYMRGRMGLDGWKGDVLIFSSLGSNLGGAINSFYQGPPLAKSEIIPTNQTQTEPTNQPTYCI